MITKFGKPQKGLLYMETYSELVLKTTTLHSGVVEKE